MGPTVPSMQTQALLEDEPGLGVVVCSGHGVHALLPISSANVPMGHARQSSPSKKEPRSQAVHSGGAQPGSHPAK